MIHPDPQFKQLGLISIVLTWLGLLLLLKRWPGNVSMSFSLHAAQQRSGQIYYFFLFCTTLPLLYQFVTNWYVPALGLPAFYVYLATAAILGQIVAVLVPAIGGVRNIIHNIGAYLMAMLLMPLTALVIYSQAAPIAKYAALCAVVIMFGFLILAIAIKSLRRKYLYFQAAYVALFHSILLVATYTTRF